MSESSGASAPSSTPVAPAVPAAAPVDSKVAAPSAPVVDNGDIGAEDLELLSGDIASSEADAVKDAQKKVEDAKGDKAKKEAKKELDKAIHKFKIKVDGEESDWEGTQEDLIRELQLSKKARKEIDKSSNIQKDVARLVEMLKNNPELVLADPMIGIDPLEFAKKMIQQQMEQESKSPDQVAREKLEKELEDLRSEKKKQAEELQQEMYQREVARYETKLEEDLQSALETAGLPKTPYILKRVTDVMLSGMENQKEITPKQALNIVKREMNKDIKDMFSVSGEELLEELLGSDTLKKLNKRQLEKIRASKKVQIESTKLQETGQRSVEKKPEEPKKKQTINEWLRRK